MAIGGDSLAAIRMIAAVEQELKIRLSVQVVFENLILEKLAARIDGAGAYALSPPFIFPLVEMEGRRPLFFTDVDFSVAANNG